MEFIVKPTMEQLNENDLVQAWGMSKKEKKLTQRLWKPID
jgi:hypothetical protein